MNADGILKLKKTVEQLCKCPPKKLLSTIVITALFTCPTALATTQVFKPLVLFPAELYKGSYSQLINNGISRFEEQTGVTVKRIRIKRNNALYVEELNKAASEGYSPIIVQDSNSINTFGHIARQHPSIRFISLDVSYHVPNILGLTFNHAEGTYVLGYLAGLKTSSNQIGFIGGLDIPVINNFQCGFELGIKDSNPKATLSTQYINNGALSWSDTDTAHTMSEEMLSKGIDIIFPAAGYSSVGVMDAVKEHSQNGQPSYSFGVDYDYSDKYPNTSLASLEKKVDIAVFAALMQLKNEIWNGNRKHFGIKQGVINVTVNPKTPKLSPEDKKIVDKLIIELKGKNNAISQRIAQSCQS
ncbi:BMP family ABC transporter substrate-binding protein [Vibrio sp. 99-70-13A1]|uniref:BMP family ABC transporter substrate-binding protein n=1 Tax=Vibrio sp. 99-70-13A1 TaxID=2607601 RepID=UPI0014934098|nr:BMP family ABC transporter substrate-binding protein [Vibrio sp. 99-70-13A1]NOH95643.1 BMP family ABC transporter substrate-binding protein [Vibrio sp. 99-70-13A1]